MRRLIFPLVLMGLCLASPALAGKSLLVDLSKSTVYAIEDGEVVRSLVINPGSDDTPTRPGTYRITQKVRTGYRSNLVDVNNKPLRKGALGAPMEYWMRLGGTGMGFHRSSLWRPNGRWGSHGCLRMSRQGARWLHDWTPKGTPVTIVSGGTKYASAVKSYLKRDRKSRSGLAKAKEKPSDREKTAKAKKPVKPALAKKKAPADKPAAKPVAKTPKPQPPDEPVTVIVETDPAPEPSVAPVDTIEEESVTEPDTQ